jgi:hypothetical protein
MPIDRIIPFMSNTALLWLICLDLIWEMVWKGIALWKAGRNGHKGWFIAILILHTVGILPLVYIFGFSKGSK